MLEKEVKDGRRGLECVVRQDAGVRSVVVVVVVEARVEMDEAELKMQKLFC